MEKKKEFMLLFRYEPQYDYKPSDEEMAAMHQQWGAFIGNIALQEKLVSTHQLGFEGLQISPDSQSTEGVHVAEKQILGGNMIVKAHSILEAKEMALHCPILHMGGSVEIRNIQPM